MKKKLIKILLDKRRRKVSGNLLEFDVTNTTIGDGTLSNVSGGNWSVVRNSVATYKNASDLLVEVAANFARIQPTGVLIEGSITNIIPYSTDFSTDWATSGAVVSSVGITDPKGGTGAYDELENTSTSGHFLWKNVALPGTIAILSFFLKKKDNDYCILFDNWSAKSTAFNFTNGLTENVTSVTTAGVIDFSNDWYRVWMRPDSNQTNMNIRLHTSRDGLTANFSYLGQSLGHYIYGSSITEEATISSYIPTNGSTVTRAADVITIAVPAGASNAETWINGVSDGGQAVTPAATFTMLNNTTKIIMN